jgi:hypothetical protein
MNTDKLLGLIFLGFMAGSVVISTSTDKDSPEVEEPAEVELVVGWGSEIDFDITPELELIIPESNSEDVTETVVEVPVEEEIGDETLPVVELPPVEAFSAEELRTLATLTADYRWKEVSDRVAALQVIIGVTDDGVYGHMTRNAHIRALKDRELDDTIVPSVPTRDITPRCEQWWDTALSVGWDESELLQLGAIMYAESRCTPDAISQTSDYGLAQINWTAHGERLSAKGITKQDLLDPVVNLREAKAIADFGLLAFGCQWQPWYMSGSWC